MSLCDFDLPSIAIPSLSLGIPSLPSLPTFTLSIPGLDLDLPSIAIPSLSLGIPSLPSLPTFALSCPLD